MASYYWIKLYDEILDDPKMGRLSDGAYRLCINLFLLANRQESRDGSLPDIEDIAWALRLSNDEAQQYLAELERAEIITVTDGSLKVTKFEKRQTAVSGKDRIKQYRERKRKEQFNEPETETEPKSNEIVTERYTDTEEDRDIDKDIDKEPEEEGDDGRVFKVYENEIGLLTQMIGADIEDAVKDYGEDWIVEAIGVAARANKRRWNYVKGILNRWKVEGKQQFEPQSRKYNTITKAADSAGGVYV
jgi:DnaD/phage-associated family protein